ncbi:unnamed protein product [Gongylonema pulchrum]|uniref:Uncharacterized protein n=1 Tax=Gongylonema pulchrum TaxID=637853 RepID=A0A183D918_9BILA|nr:unnamed protein product [Gongylonema pulchrum]
MVEKHRVMPCLESNYEKLRGEAQIVQGEVLKLERKHMELAEKFVQGSVREGGPSQRHIQEFLRKNKDLADRRLMKIAQFEMMWQNYENKKKKMNAH